MSTWSPAEFAALFQAWREAIDTPLAERNKISHEVFRRFTVLVGGSTTRSEGSVSFKQGSLKNMVRLVMAFNDRNKWFAFTLEQKKTWFKMVNRKSYKFIDIDRPLFQTVKQLIELQAASTNMRVTSASGNEFGIIHNTSLRVPLRRNTVTGAWKTRGTPPLLSHVFPQEPSSVPSPELPPLSLPVVQRQQVAAFLPTAPRVPAVVAQPSAQAPAREFPFPARAAGSRSIFEHEGGGSIFAPRSSVNSHLVFPTSSDQSKTSSQDHLTRPSKRNNVIVFDDGGYDSGSSTESDSDAEMWEESEVAAAHLRHLESLAPAPVVPPAAAASATPRSNAGVDSFLSAQANINSRARPPIARAPFPSAQIQKRSRGSVSPTFASPEVKKQKIDPELMMVVNILEKQAQELKTLIAEVKEEREQDLQQRAKEFDEKNVRQNEIQQIVETIKVEAEMRQKEHKQRQFYQEERSRMIEEIKVLQEERTKFEQERKVEEEARKTMLEQFALDREERHRDQERRETERQEREALLQQIQQDREDRQHAQAERKKILEQLEQIQQAKPMQDNNNNYTKERQKRVENLTNRDHENASKQGEQENKRPAALIVKENAAKAIPKTDREDAIKRFEQRVRENASRYGEQENKRPAAPSFKDSAPRGISSKPLPPPPSAAATRMVEDNNYRYHARQDYHKAHHHHRAGRPFDDKAARMKKFR